MRSPAFEKAYAAWLAEETLVGATADAVGPGFATTLSLRLLPDEGALVEWCDADASRFWFGGLSKGENWLRLFPDQDAEPLRTLLLGTWRERRALLCGLRGETFGGGTIAIEALALPKAARMGEPRSSLLLARVGGHAQTNRVKARIIRLELTSVRVLPEREQARAEHAARDDSTARLAQDPHPSSRRYGHLRVVDGGVSAQEQNPQTPH